MSFVFRQVDLICCITSMNVLTCTRWSQCKRNPLCWVSNKLSNDDQHFFSPFNLLVFLCLKETVFCYFRFFLESSLNTHDPLIKSFSTEYVFLHLVTLKLLCHFTAHIHIFFHFIPNRLGILIPGRAKCHLQTWHCILFQSIYMIVT